jgi:murein DD-endopeptidase MepM/ murein hydrolase activator NlpD
MNKLKQCCWVAVAFTILGASSNAIAGGGEVKAASDTTNKVVLNLGLPVVMPKEFRAEYVTDHELVAELEAILAAEKEVLVHEGGDDEEILEDEFASAVDVSVSTAVSLANMSLKTTVIKPAPDKDVCFWTDFPVSVEYPAHCYYQDWNTEHPNPYRNDVRPDEAMVYLKLRDTLNFCDYQHPFPGKITSKYGPRRGRMHRGIDIDLEVWDPVVSAFAGQVRVAKVYGAYGRVVVVRHYNGLETTYAHLHRFNVKAGDFVEAGEVIGLGGSSGRSTGSHLHFEVRFLGIPIDPDKIIDFEAMQLKGDVLVLNKVKGSSAQSVQNAVAASGSVKYHKVRKGEYLYHIARKYGVSVDRLCQMNGIRKNATLRIGQQLKVSA